MYESSPGARGSAPEQRGASKLELRAWTKNTHCRGQSRIGIPIHHITTPRASGLHRNRGLHARSRRNESRRRENPAARATRSRADVVAHIRMSRRTRGGPTQGRRGGRNEAQDEGDNPTATSREMHSHETRKKRFPLHVRKASGRTSVRSRGSEPRGSAELRCRLELLSTFTPGRGAAKRRLATRCNDD